jgi:hypothetical protein
LDSKIDLPLQIQAYHHLATNPPPNYYAKYEIEPNPSRAKVKHAQNTSFALEIQKAREAQMNQPVHLKNIPKRVPPRSLK